MKKIFTAIAMIIASLASAQNVNIPDPDFKNALVNYYPAIDINHDGEIQVSEALAVTSLSVTATNITGIQAFANLDSLDSYGNTPNLDLSNMMHLRKLLVWPSGSFNISGCINLEFLSFGFNDVPDLTINLPRLKSIDLQGQHIGNIILTGCDSLKKISLSQFMQEINKLDISGLTQIDTLKNFSGINRLIARNCTGLKLIEADLTGSVRDELDVTGCTNLKKILLIETYFPVLDLSTCSNLKIFMITAQSGYLQNLNIKNGRQLDSIYLFCSTAPTTPLNVCADDFEIDSVSHMIARHHNLMFPRQVFINSYCSFFPGGNYNTITGKLRLDLNNNGCDNADAGMPNVPIKISEAAGQYYIPSADANGDYKSYTNKGIFLIQPYFPFAYYFVNPVNTSVTFDTANNLINTSNFCIKPNGTHNDLEVIVLPLGAARPGFNTSYKLVYKNKGTTTLSGNVQLNFDNSKMNFITASTVVSSQTTGQLNWNYVNLAPFENRTINITFDLPAQPVNNMGDTLIFLAQINPVANDETAYDNSFVLPQLVRASFDPNDKECLEGSQIDISSINNYLHYLIRFQNVGNDTAFNVVIVDTLSNNLDWNTVEFIDGSHPCHISQKNNKLEFFFADIQLPYKAINEPASNGYIAFRIKPKNTLSIGDSLNNKAAIYFDFNFPVITNTATTILRSLPVIPVRLEYFSGSKQRSKNLLTWKASATNGFTNFSIERSNDGIHFISIGNITASADRCQSPFDLADNNPLAGKNFYRLKITDIDRVVFYSKIVLLENNNRYLEILSITGNNSSNAVYLNSAKQQSVQLKVVATDGRTIYLNNKIISADNSKIELPLNKIAKGIYTLIIYTSEGEMITKRFVK